MVVWVITLCNYAVYQAVTPPNLPQFAQMTPSPMPTAAAVAAAAITAKINAMDASGSVRKFSDIPLTVSV